MNEKKEIKFENLTEKEAKEFKKLLSKFIKSYSNKSAGISDKEWLKEQFIKELDIDEVEAEKMADETVDSINEYDENLKSINESSAKGISKEQWLSNRISDAATGVSINQYGEYLNGINNALTSANEHMLNAITRQDGMISQCPNLDGYIAEQMLANSFNANASLAKSKYVAEVKVPEAGHPYPKNSIDIIIKDTTSGNSVPVHQYQVKYGATASETIKMLRDHGEVTRYTNQRIVVPPEQVAEVQKAFPGKTVVCELGGTDKVPIKSAKLSKKTAKDIQNVVQNDKSVPTMGWDVFTNKKLALQIGRNAGMAGMQAAAITTGFALAEQVVKGEGIDVEKTVELAIETGADSGIKAATTGAVKVGVEKGIISIIPKGTPAGTIANVVCVSIENVKILYKAAKGEITMTEALDQMGRTSVSMVYGIGWGATGAAIGAAALSWVPVVGPVVGGLIGGTIGYMAGSKVGQAVYTGVKKVGSAAKKVCEKTWEGIKSFGKGIRDFLFG